MTPARRMFECGVSATCSSSEDRPPLLPDEPSCDCHAPCFSAISSLTHPRVFISKLYSRCVKSAETCTYSKRRPRTPSALVAARRLGGVGAHSLLEQNPKPSLKRCVYSSVSRQNLVVGSLLTRRRERSALMTRDNTPAVVSAVYTQMSGCPVDLNLRNDKATIQWPSTAPFFNEHERRGGGTISLYCVVSMEEEGTAYICTWYIL